jgi:hypothetical protein
VRWSGWFDEDEEVSRPPGNRADILSTSGHMPVLIGVVD